AFGDDAMGVTQIKEWFNCFEGGRMSADSDQRSGRLSMSQNADVIEKVQTLIMEDRHLTIQEFADEVGISRSRVESGDPGDQVIGPALPIHLCPGDS
ncbi:hypothetical protein B7P43_G09448, partial [Cryptotermes secundus]